jgi:hypothetical protein
MAREMTLLGFRSIARALLCASVILCLVIAPICATRCAASQSCTPGSPAGDSDGCHHSSNHAGSGATLGFFSANPCGNGDIVFTAPRVEERTLSPNSYTAASFFHAFALSQGALTGWIETGSCSTIAVASSPGLASAVSGFTPLRI